MCLSTLSVMDAGAGARGPFLSPRSLEAQDRRISVRRGQLVLGVQHPIDYVQVLRPYTLAERAEITCPTLACNAEGDDISQRRT